MRILFLKGFMVISNVNIKNFLINKYVKTKSTILILVFNNEMTFKENLSNYFSFNSLYEYNKAMIQIAHEIKDEYGLNSYFIEFNECEYYSQDVSIDSLYSWADRRVLYNF